MIGAVARFTLSQVIQVLVIVAALALAWGDLRSRITMGEYRQQLVEARLGAVEDKIDHLAHRR